VGVEHKFPVGSEVEATVISTVEFGAFVELEPGVEGMVHISELSQQRVGKVTDVVKVGDRKTLRVIQVDEEARRVKLSLKPAQAPGAETQQQSKPADRPAAKARPQKQGKLKGGMDKHGGLGMGLGDLKL
jgi:ribosomal protein S1